VRLTSIKISGFKSFAEPTTFMLPGQLVGVVGPNGCGKSNIIDGVRWVLGESRASELRGESMQDVIFNGTTTRKASSRASVELIFDNSDHRAGGQWSQFTEIAVKRVLTRDGTSSYYLNNQPVRRRDIQDVFLGTGLGPRAYAIIGQGTISRIIESKPEELRLFLEEAAGVSKYKERRRETENRLADTRENLVRVEDILRELNANLEKLEKQAEIANKYNSLNADVGLKQHQLWFLRREECEREQVQIKTHQDRAKVDLEAKIADLRRIEADLEGIRQSHYLAGDQLNQAQGLLYESTAEVGRLEGEIRFVVSSKDRTQERIKQLIEQREHWLEQQEAALQEIESLKDSEASQLEELEILVARLDEERDLVPALETQWREAQNKAEIQRTSVVQVQAQIQVLAADQRNIEEQDRQLEQRAERLQDELTSLEPPDQDLLKKFELETKTAQEHLHTAQAQMLELQERVPELDLARTQAQQSSYSDSSKLSDLSAKHEALVSLQEKVKTDSRLKPWLTKHGLEGLEALWGRVHIEKGWENALEAALRERLSSLEVSKLEMVSSFSKDMPPAKLTFYANNTNPGAPTPTSLSSLKPLIDLVKTKDSQQRALLSEWLQGLFTAPSLDAALSARSALKSGEAIYVAQGHAITSSSVSFYAPDNEQAGLLARAQEIENLDKEIKAQKLISEESKNNLLRLEIDYKNASLQLTQTRLLFSEKQQLLHDIEVKMLRFSQQAEQTQVRADRLESELTELTESRLALKERRHTSEARFESLDMELSDIQERFANLEQSVMDEENKLSRARDALRQSERLQQEAEFAARALVTRKSELERTTQSAQTQLSSLQEEERRLNQELAQLSDEAAKAGLQQALALKAEREQLLASKRSEYDGLTTSLRTSDESRLLRERELEPLREKITDLQLKEQAARIGFEQFDEQLRSAQADLEAVTLSIQQGSVQLGGLQSTIDKIQREIASLGAVNLAALEELSTSRERKVFLDSQSADLNEAMNTLEQAIKKIDGETRELLADTFKTVNEHFGRMFPELFGGGNARLMMTGDEILDSGVQVMAQPPGKKNQTIHLLSGGEKALTAIALVFAIFQLNPAPFCLLDEVDAPLDDANTERYSKLVKSMSKETQFLFISHNKIAMEMAEQLIGVTMQEQGVSRIVAVDMEAAVTLAEPA
jgi:chromosome segregation protein